MSERTAKQLERENEILRDAWQHAQKTVVYWYLGLRDTKCLNQSELEDAIRYRQRCDTWHAAIDSAWSRFEKSRNTPDMVRWYALVELENCKSWVKYDTGEMPDYDAIVADYLKTHGVQSQEARDANRQGD